MKTTTPPISTSLGGPFLRSGFILALFALGSLALCQLVRAVSPAPDGGYPGSNTAEGDDALFSLTTGGGNTAIGFDALYLNTTGSYNSAIGWGALYSNTTGSYNTANGGEALFSNTTGNNNTAAGFIALYSNTTGDENTANGVEALYSNTTGHDNTADGVNALKNNTTGSNNIAVGINAGQNLSIGDNNIDIGNVGVGGEANTIRIGTQETQTKTFIAGINGAAVMGTAVKVSATGQLGTAPSSARFKEEIRPMGKGREAILALKPVSFRYKKEIDFERTPQFGLVAEDVERVNPNLVDRDRKGKPYSVRYDAVNAMLLNEFLKEHGRVQELQATVTQQEKRMEVLTAQLKEQAAQIQKVSAQLEITRPILRMAATNP
jgi:uncharacterized coiled-coil protein SlyX